MMKYGRLTTFEDVASCSVGQVLDRSLSLCPEKPALIEGRERITYGDLNKRVNRFASGLSLLGIRKGDRFVVDLPNSPELVIAFCALAKLGAITTWCNPMYREKEVGFILKNSGARGILLRREFDGYDYVPMVKEAARGTGLEHIITVGGGGGSAAVEEVTAAGTGDPPVPSIDPVKDIVKIVYTSGTTGIPKGAPYTHYQAVRSGFIFSTALDTTADDIFLACLPLYHSYAFFCVLMHCLSIHAAMVLMERWDAHVALRLIQEERVTVHPAAPIHFIMEMNHPRFKDHDLSSLRAGLLSGYIPPPGLLEKIEQEYAFWVSNSWGASEIGSGAIGFPDSPREKRLFTVGRPHEQEILRVVDPETGGEVPRGTMGEITVKGWNVIHGYWNNPEETARQFDRDGWFHSGDLGVMDEDGYLTILGRVKDQINRGGLKIVPGDVEEELHRYGKIAEVAVVGTPNPVLGESICACIVPREEEAVTLQEIREFLAGRISKNKLPDELCLMKEFPRLPGGVKLNRYGPGGIRELAVKDSKRETLKKR
jgi:fatty-acyl-CoA synthase